MSDILSDFAGAFRQHGLTPPDQIVADGRIHRFRSGPEHQVNGFYRLTVLPAHQGGEIGFGLIGCWKRDVREKWCSREPAAVSKWDHAAMEKARHESRQADEQCAAEAARKAAWIWGKAEAPRPDHPYLLAKRIGPRGLREYKGMLVAPVSRDGKLASLQFIGEDGGKRFLGGGNVEGGYASISGGAATRDKLVIAEGFATAASLHEATGVPVVVAFNAGNLLAVARAIRAKYPGAELVIAGDNDQWTVVRGKAVNVGLTRARAAADAVGTGWTRRARPSRASGARLCRPQGRKTASGVRRKRSRWATGGRGSSPARRSPRGIPSLSRVRARSTPTCS